MWIVKRPHPLTAADLRKNVERLQRSQKCDDSSPPMATIYVQIVARMGRERVRLRNGNLSLHTDELQRAADLEQVLYKAIRKHD
jgi:hypothetical protein